MPPSTTGHPPAVRRSNRMLSSSRVRNMIG